MAERLKSRWRLALGRYAEDRLDAQLSANQQAQDQCLFQLYQHGLADRGHKLSAGLDDSAPALVEWLNDIDQLFPNSVSHQLQKEAIEEFSLSACINEPKVLEKLQPSVGLLKHLLSLGSTQNPAVRQQVQRIIESVVDDLLARLTPVFTQKLRGRINRYEHSGARKLANLDWQKTIKSNLKHYDLEKKKLHFQNIYFNTRHQQSLPWHVIMCIDQSGSMAESIIYSAVIAGILHRLPTISLTLYVFDTSVVDLSSKVEDPVSLLLSTQLGGGTLITKAWQVAENAVSDPRRTVIATVSDFCEGGSPQALFEQAQRLISSGVKMIGMTAMNDRGDPFYDSFATKRLSGLGMEIAALSPDQFADWLAKQMGLVK
ncbi:hypothetical protein PRUB_a1882 [Pseudoalteromonas rubra]|uniref:VWA containing CoxE family protein n=1 Tax=Pseudoalteromonas rubra TaxID=43658 RepID=A0A8T0CDN4_9GAMM|nr:VWA domain-containing protein [Pseudoalteromonas rubra]KAF7788809.1 hypothetical protein PRUB_a1882 [Pseudoalteromonas rubra]